MTQCMLGRGKMGLNHKTNFQCRPIRAAKKNALIQLTCCACWFDWKERKKERNEMHYLNS